MVLANLNKNMKWKKLVERKGSVLMLHFLIRGQINKNTLKVLGEKSGYENYLVLDNEIFCAENEYNKIQKKLNEKIKKQGCGFLMDFARKWEKIGKGLLNYAKSLNRSLKNKTNKELLSLFKNYVKKNYELSTAVQLPLNIEVILEGKIKKLLRTKLKKREKEIEKYFSVLTHPVKISENLKEQKSLLAIAIKIQKQKLAINSFNKKINKLISNHIKKFGWLNTIRFLGNPWTREEILERLVNLIKENCEQKLKEINEIEKNYLKETQRIIKELKFDKKEQLLIRAAEEYAFIRNFRIAIIVESGFIARPFFKELARRMNLNYSDLICLAPEEIIDFFEKNIKIPLKIIKERKQAFGFLMTPNKIIIFSGADLKKYKEKYLSKVIDEKTFSLKGVIASKGLVRGYAKIVKSIADLNKVNNGDILIASMTTPEMILAMEKAAAFITDEGGITCHAAIISREMNKPCIINTKKATKVLKDGDLVEVDADKGVVKILK